MLSVTIVARDAEKFLPQALLSVQHLSSDVVVVVDPRSTDATDQKAKAFKATVYHHRFDDFASQKNFAASKARYDWILSLDADETLTPELVEEIKMTLPHAINKAYYIPRKNRIFGRYINHTNWDPHGLIRLYDRRFASFQGIVHEKVVTTGRTGSLRHPLLHSHYASVEEFLSRANGYTSMEAEQLHQRGTKFSLGGFFFFPCKDFVRRFFLHAGFLDGWHGLFLSYLMMIYHFSVRTKVWLKQQNTIL